MDGPTLVAVSVSDLKLYKYSETIQHKNWVIAGSGVRQVKTGGAAASPDIRPKFFSFLTVYSEKKHQN